MSPPLVIIEDSREVWHPVDADESLAQYGYNWVEVGWERDGLFVDQLDLSDVVPSTLPSTGYLEESEGQQLTWLRFHLWTLFNPGPPRFHGIGSHQGDWEMVQIGVDKHDGTPITAILSQHSGAQKRDWWNINNNVGIRDDGSWYIVVYMALGSHALYFAPGERLGYGDTCDGEGAELAPHWKEPGEWWNWVGLWGEDGPKSPGKQRGTPDDFSARLDT